MNSVRIDKWLWAVRLFKTRTIAAEACKLKRITIGGQHLKASREIRMGDVVQVRKNGIIYSFKVLQLSDRRMGAKLVPDFIENVTTADQLELLEQQKLRGFIDRAKGTGRPTKRDRRDLDEFAENGFEFEDDFFDEDE